MGAVGGEHAGDRVMKRTPAETIIQTILDTRQDTRRRAACSTAAPSSRCSRTARSTCSSTVARRLQGRSKERARSTRSTRSRTTCCTRDRAHRPGRPGGVRRGYRLVRGREARKSSNMVCDLYALTVIEDDKAWFIEHRHLSIERAKAVTRGINERCRTLRPYAQASWSTASAFPSNCATCRNAAPGEHPRRVTVKTHPSLRAGAIQRRSASAVLSGAVLKHNRITRVSAASLEATTRAYG